MKATVLIPTFRRTKDLSRCLEGFQAQYRMADEVLVIVRETDQETLHFLQEHKSRFQNLPTRIVLVQRQGQVAALNMGLAAAHGDFVAILDDDAVPRPHWLEQIEKQFEAHKDVGGVGGRDWIHNGDHMEEGTTPVVGKIQWFGRMISHHHLGTGKPRYVDTIRGANMSFRRTAIKHLRFDERLLGSGAQIHNDVAFCLTLKRSGWNLLYDPAVEVDHYVSQRFDEDQRNTFNFKAQFNIVHNETLTLLEHFAPAQRIVYLLYSFLIGQRTSMGLVQLLRFVLAKDANSLPRYSATSMGRISGIRAFFKSRKM